MHRDRPVFEWGANEPMEDVEHDDEYHWDDDDDDDHDPNNDPDNEPVDHSMNQNPRYVGEICDEREQNDNIKAQEHEEPAPIENQEQDPMDEEAIENETSNNDEPVENRSHKTMVNMMRILKK